MTKPKSAIKIPNRNESIYIAAVTIKAKQKSISTSVFGLIDTIDQLRRWGTPDEITSLLADGGLNASEIATYTSFASSLGVFRESLEANSVSFDAIRALIAHSSDAAIHAVSLLASNGRVGDAEIARLRGVTEAASIPDQHANVTLRNERLRDASYRLADHYTQRITDRSRQLYSLMQKFEEWQSYLSCYFDRLEADAQEGLIGDDEIAQRQDAWPQIEADGQEFLAKARHSIIARSTALLKDFDYLLPEANITKEDWLNPKYDLATRSFAEARYALQLLADGSFSRDFPSDDSRYHSWRALDSVGYFAGVLADTTQSERYAPRPARKLNAISIRTASGADLVGLDNAGFRIRGLYLNTLNGSDTASNNRHDWEPGAVSFEDPEFFTDIAARSSALNGQPIHLLVGTMPGEPFREHGRGMHDGRERFARAIQTVGHVQPKAFYFECGMEFLEQQHAPFRTRLIAQARQIGYTAVDVIEIDAANFGVPQDRRRTVLMGVRSDSAAGLRVPCLVTPIKRTVGEAISEIAFPYLAKILKQRPKERSPGQVRYVDWANKWLGSYGNMEAVPDTITLSRKPQGYAEKWREAGFLVGDEGVLQPGPELSIYSRLPLSIDILKRLQGVPSDWQFHGTYDEQVDQICQTPPVLITRVLGHCVHEALTGHAVDLDRAARSSVDSKRWKRKGGFKSMSEADDPALTIQAEWRSHLRDQEFDGP